MLTDDGELEITKFNYLYLSDSKYIGPFYKKEIKLSDSFENVNSFDLDDEDWKTKELKNYFETIKYKLINDEFPVIVQKTRL